MAQQVSYTPVFWAPDLDPSWLANPGVLTEVRNMVPTTRKTLANYACTSGEQFQRVPALALANTIPISAAGLKLTTGVAAQRARIIIGTMGAGGGSYLLEAVPGTGFVDVSRAAGGPYVGGEYQFAAFADTILATTSAPYGVGQPSEIPQFSTAIGGAFANLTGCSIKAAVICVNKGYVLLGNVYDGVSWYGDGWACCALQNINSWPASLSASLNNINGPNYGRLTDTPGQIRAFVPMRDTVIAYKPDAIYVGRTTGNALTWGWTCIAQGVGQSSGNGVAVVNGVHYFIHRTGLYAFDGTYPRNIGIGLANEWLAAKLQHYLAFTQPGPKAVVDEARSVIYFYVRTNDQPARTAGMLDAALVYNYVTGQIGWIDAPWADNSTAEIGFGCPVQVSREDLGQYDSVAQLFPGIVTVGSIGGSISMRIPVVGRGSLTSETTSQIATGDIGDETSYSRLSVIKPRLVVGDDDSQVASCTVDGKAAEGDFFDGEGFQIQALATGTGAGYCRVAIRNMSTTGFPRYTVGATDMIAFDFCMIAGDVATPVGVRFQRTDGFFSDFLGVPTALGQWKSAAVSMAALAGKILQAMDLILDVPGSAIQHNVLIRRVRITDASGALLRRLFRGTEERFFTFGIATSNYSNASGFVSRSIGQAFTHDATRRQFAGQVENRWHRPRITFYNETELAALFVDLQATSPQ